MTATAMTANAPTICNGVDVTAMKETVEAVKAEPAIAKFQFRATNTWMGGSHNRSTIKGFYGAGQEDATRTQPFVLDAEEPTVLLGRDTAANPVEFVLHALAACMTTTLTYQAAARDIAIQAIDSKLEGDLDLRGFLDLAPVRKGYSEVRVHMRVRTKADKAVLAELVKFSPVHDMISRALPVKVTIETY